MFVGTLIAIPIFIISIPVDYFEQLKEGRGLIKKHPLAYFVLRIARNTAGVILLGMGIAMLLLPGQGLLTMLVGLILIDFPGKKSLILRIVQNQTIYNSLNWIRECAHRPPLKFPKNP